MNIEYEGRVYVRPIGRGVVLLDGNLKDQHFEDVVPEGYYHLKFEFERLEGKEEATAHEAHLD
jgi:hypothetical protein